MNRARQPRIIFITGTDTGVGKTVLTGLLLAHLRRTGCHALALKPFCSGGRGDARLLHVLQDRELTLDEVNPYFFAEPVAPLVVARKQRSPIPLTDVLYQIRAIAARLVPSAEHPLPRTVSRPARRPQSCLLIEGSGGLLVPLGEGIETAFPLQRSARQASTAGFRSLVAGGRGQGRGGPIRSAVVAGRPYTVLDLIVSLGCEVIVVARNRLGTLNHSLLTVRALQGAGIKRLSVAMMEGQKRDTSAYSNRRILAELVAPVPVQLMPFLGRRCRTATALRLSAARLRRVLSHLA